MAGTTELIRCGQTSNRLSGIDLNDKDSGLNCLVVEYVKMNQEDLFNFLCERNVSMTALSQDQLLQSIELGKGVSGARKLTLDGRVYIIKMQNLTPEFQNNLMNVLNKGMPIYHSLVSESDDSFMDFPRKEVLGVRIARVLGIGVPQTQLVTVGTKEIGSLQEFISEDKAVAMSDKINSLSPADIELQSAVNVIFFHAITENIDGHCGNVLLEHVEQNADDDDDDFNPDYRAVPIDFGLIFPRHDSVYPRDMNLVKKGFLKFFEQRKISVEQNLAPLVKNEEILNSPEIQSIARDHELSLLHTNFRAMQKVASENKGRIRVSKLFDKFISNVVVDRQTHIQTA